MLVNAPVIDQDGHQDEDASVVAMAISATVLLNILLSAFQRGVRWQDRLQRRRRLTKARPRDRDGKKETDLFKPVRFFARIFILEFHFRFWRRNPRPSFPPFSGISFLSRYVISLLWDDARSSLRDFPSIAPRRTSNSRIDFGRRTAIRNRICEILRRWTIRSGDVEGEDGNTPERFPPPRETFERELLRDFDVTLWMRSQSTRTSLVERSMARRYLHAAVNRANTRREATRSDRNRIFVANSSWHDTQAVYYFFFFFPSCTQRGRMCRPLFFRFFFLSLFTFTIDRSRDDSRSTRSRRQPRLRSFLLI